MSAVVATGVGKVFDVGGGRRVDALVGVDLTIEKGEFVSLIGPSGCGKSTLLRLIADLLQPTSGELVVNGKTAHQARLDQDYGMAFQQSGLFEWRSVERNIELPLELKGWDKSRRRARSREMLELVKLQDFAGHMPWQLSGGMQQRVAIARALAAHPELLLMDEPFGALDEMTREHMQAELLRICAEMGTTVVFVTHSIPEAVYLADRVVVMSPRPGRITDLVDVKLGRDRSELTREATEFFERVTEVREALRRPETTAVDEEQEAFELRNFGVDDRVNLRLRRLLGTAIPPIVFGALFVAVWQWWVVAYEIQPFVVPRPSNIWKEFVDQVHLVREASIVTGFNALIGLVLGAILGFAVAVVTNRFRLVSELVNPLAVTVAAIPAVVIVGVLNNMYALDSQIGRRIMVTLAVFFIVFVQVTKGLRQNDATQLELMRSYAATPRQVLAKVRLPNTMPYLFTAIRTAAPIAVIIALVSEYFGGTQDGLGSKIASTLNSSNKELGFAYVLGGSIVGLLFFAGSSLLEFFVVPWQRRRPAR